MTESNRSIWIISTESGHAEEVVIGRTLRILPGKREVSEASWGDRPVVMKFFHQPIKALYHYWRELRGLRRLAKLGIRAPVLLFSGRTREGHWAIVTEMIDDAQTGHQLWGCGLSPEAKRDLLDRVAAELAHQHGKGVAQADLHMGNFMFRGKDIFALDVAQMRFYPWPLGRRAGIKGLAMLLGYLRSDDVSAIDHVAATYAKQRQWHWGSGDDCLLRDSLRAARGRQLRRLLDRSLRTSSRAVAFRDHRFKGVFVRSFAERTSLSEFCAQIDDLANGGEVLKDGRTCFVSRAAWNGQDLVIKRHNHKGLWHSLRHTTKGSRARRNWINAHRLLWMGISTPRPIGYLNEYRGPVLWRSYFVTQFVSNPTVRDVFRDPEVSREQKRLIHENVLAMLQKMANRGIRHGDMKHANVLCDGTRIILTDLDAMCLCRPRWLWRHLFAKDMNRYLRDLSEAGIAGSSISPGQ